MAQCGAEEKHGEVACDDDDELDALLDDALKDFEPTPKTQENVETKSKANANNPPGCTDTETNNTEDENFAQFTNDLSDVLEKMVMDEPSLKAHFETFQQKMETSGGTGGDVDPDLFDFDKNLSKTLEEFTKNFPGLAEDNDEEGGECEDVEEMLKQMHSELGGDGGGGGGSDGGGFMGMMQGMMENLLSKDLLYPSLKEIKEKYPAWFETNKTKISAEELDKYKKQEDVVCKLCELFESETENDSEIMKKERTLGIVSLMEQMQEYGHPPADMMENIVCGDNEGAAPSTPECNLM